MIWMFMRKFTLTLLICSALIFGFSIHSIADPINLNGKLINGTTNPFPRIDVFLPVEKGRTDIGVIIFPGGGYRGLAEHEGAGYAHFFQSKGIAAFVVEYRLAPGGHKHPAMLEDALAAIETICGRST